MKRTGWTVLVGCLIFLVACSAEERMVTQNSEIQPLGISPAEEREFISNSIDALTRVSGLPVTYLLPLPRTDGYMSLEQALANRRSRRNFQDKEISAEQLSQILWAAYGITQARPDSPQLRGGLRTTPSAGALYPLEIYVIIGNVADIEPGVYRYIADGHMIVRVVDGDVRSEVGAAALGQRMIREAPVTVFYSAVYSRMTGRYGDRGIMYTHMEVGHSAQNVYLQVEALGLGTVAVGAFSDDRVRRVLNLPDDESPLYLMPIGHFYGE